LVDGTDSLEALLFSNGITDAKLPEQVVEEKCQFVLIEGAALISIVLIEYFVNVCLEHLILDVEGHDCF
jgi:hypothetical protein